MAEITDQEAQFLATLETLESDPDALEAEEAADQEDESLAKIARQTDRKVEAFITEQKIDKKVQAFATSASPEAQELFAIYRTGDESEKQLERIMQLAITKSSEARKGKETEEDSEDDAELTPEQIAQKIAAEQYGVGPVSGGQVGAEKTPDQRRYDEMFAKVETDGDPMALLGLMAEDSPFIDAVLTGKSLRKE